jgi:hypothetical protein
LLAIAVAISKRFNLSQLLATFILLLTVYDFTGTTKNEVAMPWMKDAPVRALLYRPIADQVGLNRVFPLGLSSMASKNLISGWHPKIGMQNRFSTPFNYDPLTPKTTADFLAFGANGKIFTPRDNQPFTGAISFENELKLIRNGRNYLSAMNVQYYLLKNNRDPKIITELESYGFRKIENRDVKLKGTILLKDPAAMPRAYGAYGVKCAIDTEDALGKLATLDLHRYVLLEQNCTGRSPQRGAVLPTVYIASYEQTRIVLHVVFTAPGHVVLADSFYPGWSVELNESPAEILKVNVLARGVAVPAGEHIIEFVYKPKSIRTGFVIAGCSFFVILLLAFQAYIYKSLNIIRAIVKIKFPE